MFSNFTLACIMIPAFISIFRIVAIFKFYHAPLDIAYHFQYTTIPHILTSLGHGPKPAPKNYSPYTPDEVIVPEWDYTPLMTLDPPISLCYASEWHRYPGSYMIPEGIDVRWVKTDFDGMMPRRWESSAVSNTTGVWPRPETRVVRDGRFNGMNKASVEPGTFVSLIHYPMTLANEQVPVEQCNYLVSLNLPSQPHTDIEQDYIHDPSFEKEYCTTFLDGASSKWWARLVWIPWLPQGLLDRGRVYGEYCLLKRK
jgi:alpha-1,2-mannosyltransferase